LACYLENLWKPLPKQTTRSENME